MKKIAVNLTILLVLCSFAFNFVGCANISAEDLMEGIEPNKVERVTDLKSNGSAISDFALRLFKESMADGETNSSIAPLSVLCALAMVANGADGNTRQELENTLGMSVEELNVYLKSYVDSLYQGEKYKLALANSIWFTDDPSFSVNQEFLQINADYHGADIYKAPFKKSTLNDINKWVKNETNGMIDKILDEIPPESVMYLVNTLAFEAEWTEIYEKHQVRNGIFTTESGEEQNVKFMHSNEGSFLEDENATGFIKYYKERKYAFVALLPNEGVKVSDYLSSLDGESLNKMLSEPTNVTVYASIPKFESEYSIEMSDVLKNMGAVDAFDPQKADFSKLGSSSDGNIFINRVLHKTYISVAEKGTKAGAVTVIEMNCGSAAPMEEKYVHLDRPFVYMLIDTQTNIPFFIGSVMNLE